MHRAVEEPASGMPLMRLSWPTTERSLERHLQSLMAHLGFGAVAELVRAQTIAAMSQSTR